MPFCRFCGAEIVDENTPCDKCPGQPTQYYQQPMPMIQPIPPKDTNVALIVVVLIIVFGLILAGPVLYVMVIGFGSPGVGYSTPAGAWSATAESETSGQLTFSRFTEDVAPTDIRIYVRENGTSAGILDFTGDNVPSPAPMEWFNGPSGASAEYVDYNYAGGEVGQGDHIILSGLKSDTEYSFEVYHIPTDAIIMMAGNGDFFITD